jgi:hypothetical protein
MTALPASLCDAAHTVSSILGAGFEAIEMNWHRFWRDEPHMTQNRLNRYSMTAPSERESAQNRSANDANIAQEGLPGVRFGIAKQAAA